MDLHEYEDSLVYTVSSIHSEILSKKITVKPAIVV